MKIMANNCLITNLKSFVQNDNLPIFDTIKIKFKNMPTAGVQFMINPVNGKEIIFKGSSDVGFDWTSSTSYKNPFVNNRNYNGMQYINSGEEQYIYIEHKYNIDRFEIEAFRDNYYDSINAYAPVPISFVFNLADFEYCTSIRIINLERCMVTGNINKLCKLITLNHIALSHGDFYGDIVELVQGQISNGRTSTDSFTFRLTTIKDTEGRTNVKFNGKGFPDIGNTAYIGHTVGWDSISKIYIKFGDETNLYCIGYTDQEITAKTAAGGEWEGYTVSKRD